VAELVGVEASGSLSGSESGLQSVLAVRARTGWVGCALAGVSGWRRVGAHEIVTVGIAREWGAPAAWAETMQTGKA